MKYAARLSTLLALILFATLVAGAQEVAPSVGIAASGPPATCSMTIGPLRGSLIAGAVTAYSAVVERSRTQTLADGTVIAPKPQTEKTYRDSQGRTRNERPFCQMRGEEPSATYVEIRDPVAGYGYILDANTRTAHRYALQLKERDTGTTGGAAISLPAAAQARPELSPLGVGVTRSVAAGNRSTSESLGTQTMEGVTVEGTRTTTTIPVGEVGNDRPFLIVRETWNSALLKTNVLMKTTDPRFGESVTRLTNIDLSEPSLSLFQPPPDYTVADETEHVRLTVSAPKQKP